MLTWQTMCPFLRRTFDVCAIMAWLVAPSCGDPAAIAQLDLAVTPSTHLLVLAPHPDDEALAAAGLMQRVQAAGGRIRVVLMTSGDAFDENVHRRRSEERDAADRRESGNRRERESIAAMARIGVDRSQLRLLGFPDMGLCLLA